MTFADAQLASYDALLFLSFGGPEKEEEVVPFLENVTRGRGIPRERLRIVGEHYFHFGGKSPINDLNKEIISHLEVELTSRGHILPIYFGNRNWYPFAHEAAERMSKDGVRNALVFATSAWGGYSGCRQYGEDIHNVRKHLKAKGLADIQFTKIRQFFDHPRFVAENAAALQEAITKIGSSLRPQTRVIFSAHSIPMSHDQAGGGAEDAHLYSRQVAESARLVAQAAGIKGYDLVWQSRSGSPHTPWLEPDIVAHVRKLHAEDEVTAVVVCALGFISDHMEVIWDIDCELKAVTEELGLQLSRARTIGPSSQFATMIVDLVEELTEGRAPEAVGTVSTLGCSINGAPCRPGCCQIPRRPH
ncbi:MAG: ferrochelatase [Corynebacterium sp.]|nr:ferrochelatase [Corynebacterium sp.]